MDRFFRITTIWALIASAFGFIVFFCLLSFFNRFAADDYYLLSVFREEGGVFSATGKVYADWVPRWASLLHLNTWIFLFGENMVLPYQIVTFLFLLTGTFVFFRSLFLHYFEIPVKVRNLWLLSVLFSMGCFYATFNTGELWFWISSSVDYLWSLSFLLFGTGLILIRSNRVYHYLLLTFPSAYIGGSVEPLAMTILLFLVPLLIYRIIGRKPVFRGSVHYPKLLYATAVVGFSFVIVLLSPGRVMRMAVLPEPDVIAALKGMWVAAVQYGKRFLEDRILMVGIMGLIWLCVSTALPGLRRVGVHAKKIKRIFIFLIPANVIFCFLLSLILGDAGPDRAYSLVVFSFSLSWMLLFFHVSEKIAGNPVPVHFRIASALLTIGLAVLLYFHFKKELVQAREYAFSVDERTEWICSRSRENSTLVLKPLPDPGLLYSAEITGDTLHFRNVFLKKWCRTKKSLVMGVK